MKKQRWCLWSRTFPNTLVPRFPSRASLLEGGLRSLRSHHRAGAAASSSGSVGRARRDWDDDRYQSHRNASSDEAVVLERHFDSIASIKGKRAQPPTRLWESREGGALWLSGDARSRDQQWKEALPVIRQTLMSGGSGWDIAWQGATVQREARRSLITDSTFQEAQATVGRLRECQIYKLMSRVRSPGGSGM